MPAKAGIQFFNPLGSGSPFAGTSGETRREFPIPAFHRPVIRELNFQRDPRKDRRHESHGRRPPAVGG